MEYIYKNVYIYIIFKFNLNKQQIKSITFYKTRLIVNIVHIKDNEIYYVDLPHIIDYSIFSIFFITNVLYDDYHHNILSQSFYQSF